MLSFSTRLQPNARRHAHAHAHAPRFDMHMRAEHRPHRQHNVRIPPSSSQEKRLLRTPKPHSRSEDFIGVRVVLLLPDTILGDDLDQHTLEIHRQTSPQLVGAHSQNLHALVEINVRVVVLVEDTEAVVLGVAVGGVGQGSERREIVAPVQAGLVGYGVVAAEQEVHVVGFAAAEGLG